MDFFVLDEQPQQAADWLCDAHIVHMPERAATLLSTVWRSLVKHVPHTPHNWPLDKPFLPDSLDLELPWVRWVLSSKGNYNWFADYAFFACEQYESRFGHRPLYAATVGVLHKPPYALQEGRLHPFLYPVEVYRVMYASIPNISWRHTTAPPWLSDYRR